MLEIQDSKKEKWIIDTDPGVDDFYALIYLLKNPNIEVLMISLTHGNVSMSDVEENAKRACKLANVYPQIFKGSEYPLIKESENASEYQGVDGLGDIEAGKYISTNDVKIEEGNASIQIVDYINKYPGEITILSIAPSTNVAMAYMLDPSIVDKMKKVVIMGGSIKGVGVQLPLSEFNFGFDYITTVIVVNNFKNIIIIPWEALYNTITTLEVVKSHENLKNESNKALFTVSELLAVVFNSGWRVGNYCDLNAVQTVINPKVVAEFIKGKGEVIMDSFLCRGLYMVKDIQNIEKCTSWEKFQEELELIEKGKNNPEEHIVVTRLNNEEIFKDYVSIFK